MPWQPDDITFVMLDEQTDDPVVTVMIETPAGRVMIMAEVTEQERVLCLHGLHMHGLTPNEIGAANLRMIAQVVMEGIGYDEIEIEGGVRTTGANPGRRPRPIRFTRRARPAAKE